MTTASDEAVPVMPDVRMVQREARQITAILKWPVHLIFAVLLTVWTGVFSLPESYSDKGAGIMLIIFGLCICVMALFRKQILRAFLGAQTPMIFEKNSSGPRRKTEDHLVCRHDPGRRYRVRGNETPRKTRRRCGDDTYFVVLHRSRNCANIR